MALITNVSTRYDAERVVREDLANVIYNISPSETPLMSNIGKDTAKQTFFEWNTDTLASASSTNAQFEGDSVTGADDRDPTTRVGNYTQISRKVIGTSGTVEAVDAAGMKSLMAYELAKASAELKTDIEKTICSNSIAAAGNNTTARTTAGLGSWLITNVDKASGGTNPEMSGSNGNGYPDTARIRGTARNFTETILKNVAQQVWTGGGKLKMLLVGPAVKVVASGFTGIAAQRYNVTGAEPSTIVGAADVYVSDFGNVSIVPSRLTETDQAYFVDPEYLSIAYLRNFQTVQLAKIGDADRKMIVVEYGLRCKNEKAHGIAADLND